MSKKIYIAGKITGECETPELMIKCKDKFYSYSSSNSSLEEEYHRNESVVFYLGKNNSWYTHGLFINRAILGNGTWQEYMKNDLSVLMTCDEVHFLPDWKESKGAKIEHQLAIDLGIKIVYILSQVLYLTFK